MLNGYIFRPEDARGFTREKEAPWFRDGVGRYLLFRGTNLGSRAKLPPYVPVYPMGQRVLSQKTLEAELVNVRNDLAKLKLLGFNAVRLVVQWKGLAPDPRTDPKSDPKTAACKDYLAAVKTIVEELFGLGIYSLIDFHQDIAWEGYGGDGFPDWAVLDPPPRLARVNPTTEWGFRILKTPFPPWPFVIPNLHKRVRDTLTAFWKNDVVNRGRHYQARQMFVDTIRATADALKGVPGILGYEPFNEPSQVTFRKKKFERQYLQPFYIDVINAISEVDPQSAVFIEPRVDWNYVKATTPEGIAELVSFIANPKKDMVTYLQKPFTGSKTVFAFHYYDPTTDLLVSLHLPSNLSSRPALWSKVFARTIEIASELDLIPFMTEFGAGHRGFWKRPSRVGNRLYPSQTAAYMDLSLQQIEKNLLNSLFWCFDLYSTKDRGDNWNNEDDSVLGPGPDPSIRTQDIIARPYPWRSSAKPSLLFFDSRTRHGVIMMRGKPVDEPSVIYVPDAIQYPGGFDVHHTGGELAWDAANHLLYWSPRRVRSTHQVVICPRNGLDRTALPRESQAILSDADQVHSYAPTGRSG